MKFFPLFRYARVMARILGYSCSRIFFFCLHLLSRIANYTTYYFRRAVLCQTDQQARKLTDEEYQHYLNRNQTINPIPVKGKAILVDRNIFLPGELTPENKHVNALWIGTRLSKMEMLTLQSFVDNGHTFHLWAYEKIENELPDGVIAEDANAVIPKEKIFRYKYVNKYGHGKGSVSGFSDIFRYKLLYEKGGWWTDMDVTCLKPLNAATPYFFRKHHDLELVGNVMKCPPKSALMLLCYTEAAAQVDENNTDWHKPIEILNKHVFANQLQAYIFQQVSNLDMWSELVRFVTGAKPVPDHYFFIHWMNEEWRSREIDKNEFRFKSALGEIMINAGLLQKPVSKWTFFKNDFWHVIVLRIYYYS